MGGTDNRSSNGGGGQGNKPLWEYIASGHFMIAGVFCKIVVTFKDGLSSQRQGVPVSNILYD